jgi:microcystin-dependent protein
MTLYRWSQDPAADATADSSINWQEGQAPSSINDSARAMMAATAKFRDDISGAIATGGTSTAYTVASYQVFDSLTHLNGQMIAFTPHTTNGGSVTLNVDSLGAKPLRSAPGGDLPAGVLVQGTPYIALYTNSDGAFYLRGFFNNPWQIPIGGLIDYTGSSSPNSSFILPVGQAISRTTYAAYFSMISTTYGAGDGSTTFNVPDLRGRVVAGTDNMGGAAAGRLNTSGGMSGVGISAAGGSQTITLTPDKIPTLTSSGSNSITVNVQSGRLVPQSVSVSGFFASAGSGFFVPQGTGIWEPVASFSGSNNISVTTSGTGGLSTTLQNIQPTITLNKLLRII